MRSNLALIRQPYGAIVPSPTPIYTSDNVKFAYQLRWGATIHWHLKINEDVWLEPLCNQLEDDGIRVLSWRWLNESACQFALSTKPNVTPLFISQRLKGRLHHLCKATSPRPLRKHFALRSFGTQDRRVVEGYVAKQCNHHPMACERTTQIFRELRYENCGIDLSESTRSTHGEYWHNLHIVLVNENRWCDVNRERLIRLRNGLVNSCQNKHWQLKHFSVLADHMHLSMGCPIDISPAVAVLSLMNNVAWYHDMKPILMNSAFVCTFGEYDHRSIEGSNSHR